ncbi:MAG: hypothetical protein ACT443_10500 [Gemmatimonadota bacterium]
MRKYEITMDPTPQPELIALSEHPEYRVSAEDTDPRGWSVVDSDNVPAGIVEDLIIDAQALIARYMLCSIAHDARAVLIPTGFARLEEQDEIVHLEFVTVAELAALPGYRGLPLSAEFCTRMDEVLTGEPPSPAGRAKIVRRRS